MTHADFSALGLSPAILRNLAAENYSTPTPIQSQAIPPLLAGRDLLGVAQTGTGKTAAFALPILHRLSQSGGHAAPKAPRALILAPTRELVIQIADSLNAYGKGLAVRVAVVIGGVGMNPQTRALARAADIVVATPGRLIDHMQQGNVRLDAVECLVLDEADRMLDMGFSRDVRRIVGAAPKARQSLLFSATMPRDIEALANDMLRDPVKVSVTPKVVTADRIEQCVYFVPGDDKFELMRDLFTDRALSRVIVFARTKHGANKLAEKLSKAGVPADAIHGNKSQGARQRALEGFRNGEVRALVATDIAARGIDVDGVTHVINYELPNEAENYVHRIGRTARAGAGGGAISLCGRDEQGYWRDILKLIRRNVPVAGGEMGPDEPAPHLKQGRGGGRGRGRSGGGGAPRFKAVQGGGGHGGGGGGRNKRRNRNRGGARRAA
ncbi:MAG: DEAD/DEAH box helicase [Maricaulaceae bacterium]|nr:DEAD/DEAH box helicase [Maricaulaceae bacterium]